MDKRAAFADCFVCQLPAETQGEFSLNDEDWVMVVCLAGHAVTVRTYELLEAPGSQAAA